METNLVTVNDLIELLYVNPSNDKEVGFNSAIIVIMKNMTNVGNDKNSLDYLLRRTINDDFIYNKITLPAEQALFTLFKEGKKLVFIKALKDATELGLKEAKDIADNFFNLARDKK